MSDRFVASPAAQPSPPATHPRTPQWVQPEKGPRPDTVTNAVRLMYALVLVNLIGVVVLFATKDDLRKSIRDNTPNATDTTVNSAVTVAFVIAAVFIVLYGLLAFQVSRGRSWARNVTWVLAGLAIVSGLVGLGQPEPALTHVLSAVGLVVEVAVVVLLMRRRSHAYFRP